MKMRARTLRLGIGVSALLIFVAGARAETAPTEWAVSTSDVKVTLTSSPAQPRVAAIDVPSQPPLMNGASEQLPQAVEIAGASVPLIWQHRGALDTHDSPHRVVFVYESANPHLRLGWEWQARADFGPVEHRIIVENLGDKEVWFPMLDSLRIDFDVPAASELRN